MNTEQLTKIITGCACRTLDYIPESEITPTARFYDDLGADSIDQVEIIMDVEKELNVSMPDMEAEEMRTIQNIVDFISKTYPNL